MSRVLQARLGDIVTRLRRAVARPRIAAALTLVAAAVVGAGLTRMWLDDTPVDVASIDDP